MDQEAGVHQNPNSHTTWILNCPASATVENKCLWFISHPSMVSLLQQLRWTKEAGDVNTPPIRNGGRKSRRQKISKDVVKFKGNLKQL